MKNLNPYLIAFGLLIGKGLVLSFDWQTVCILSVLLAFKYFNKKLSDSKPTQISDNAMERLKSIESRLNLSKLSHKQ